MSWIQWVAVVATAAALYIGIVVALGRFCSLNNRADNTDELTVREWEQRSQRWEWTDE